MTRSELDAQIRAEVDLWLAVCRDRGIVIHPASVTPLPGCDRVAAVKSTVASVWRSYQDGLRLLERIGELEEQEAARKRQEVK